jgi:hypothetical protein
MMLFISSNPLANEVTYRSMKQLARLDRLLLPLHGRIEILCLVRLQRWLLGGR